MKKKFYKFLGIMNYGIYRGRRIIFFVGFKVYWEERFLGEEFFIFLYYLVFRVRKGINMVGI